MKKTLIAAALSFGFAAHAYAQGPLPRNDKILIDYQDAYDVEAIYGVDPRDTDEFTQKVYAEYKVMKELSERLKERKVLERYAQFLVPLRLPTTLRLVAKQCNGGAFFSPVENSITICYEYVRGFEQRAPQATTDDGITRDDAIIGSLVSTLLHETGHALFHLFKIPVLGREEDAADQIAAYVMLQFGDQVALTVVRGTMWKWARNWGLPNDAATAAYQLAIFSDEHSTNQQRFYTFLCIAYGGKPRLFQPFIDAGYIPAARAASCRRDYEQAERAFTKTVLPYIDRNLMQKVQSASWFLPQDMGLIPVETR